MEKLCPKCFKKYPPSTERCDDDGSYLVSPSERDLVGETLDERYKVLSKLGQGGMGVVYRAEQSFVDRIVALKVLRREVVQDDSAIKRFLTEARAIATLRNQHTITLHDFGVTKDGLLYYTMDLVEGASLSRILKTDGTLDFRRAANLILQACASLEESHAKGILHRDLKPDNLMISDEDGADFVTVLDFGIARLLEGEDAMDRITRTGMICGTPAYLSPEQGRGGDARPASDLYALGIILYEVLTGAPPFMDKTAISILMKHINESPPPVHLVKPELRVPAAMDDFIQVALRKDPDERHQTVAKFRDALQAAVARATEYPESVEITPMEVAADGARGLPTQTSDDAFEEVDAREQPRAVVPARKPVPAWAWGGLVLFAAALVLMVWQPWAGRTRPPGGVAKPAAGQVARPPADAASGPVTVVANASPDITDLRTRESHPAPRVTKGARQPDLPSPPAPEPADAIFVPRTDAAKPAPVDFPAPPPAPEPIQVIVDTDPRGALLRWQDDESEPREGPALFKLTPADDGKVLLCTRDDFEDAKHPVRFEEAKETGKIIIKLKRKKRTVKKTHGGGHKGKGSETATGKEPETAPEKGDGKKTWGEVEIPKGK